jgi:hypothetical protein
MLFRSKLQKPLQIAKVLAWGLRNRTQLRAVCEAAYAQLVELSSMGEIEAAIREAQQAQLKTWTNSSN